MFSSNDILPRTFGDEYDKNLIFDEMKIIQDFMALFLLPIYSLLNMLPYYLSPRFSLHQPIFMGRLKEQWNLFLCYCIMGDAMTHLH